MKTRVLYPVFILLVPLLLISTHINDIAYGSNSSYSDLLITHYPNLLYLKRSIIDFHQIPLWSDQIFGGYPFAANPLAGIWYPFNWILLILPEPFGFNFSVIIHLLLGGLGLYLFLIDQRVSSMAALLGAINFELMPKLFGHYGAGHISLLFAVGWTTWLLWAEERSQSCKSLKRYSYIQPILLSMIILADVRWALFAGLVWMAYSFYLYIHNRKSARFIGWISSLLIKVLFASCLAAPLLLPLAEFTYLSTRSLMTSADRLFLSLPPPRLLGLWIMDIGGGAEWTVYQGAVAFLLVISGVSVSEFRKKHIFWWIVLALSMTYALGSYIPGMDIFTQLPGINLIRVPSRSMIIVGLIFSILSAYAIDALLQEKNSQIHEQKVQRLLLTAVIGFELMITIGIICLTKKAPPPGFIWSTVALLFMLLILFLRINHLLDSFRWLLLVFIFLILDMGTFDYLQIRYQPLDVVLSKGEMIAEYMQNQPGIFRVYSPSYSLPQENAALHSIELADGIDPMQLLSYVRYMEKATGIPNESYSVTLPPFPTGDTVKDNRLYLPDSKKLGLLNVGYVVAEYEITSKYLLFKDKIGSTWVYQNKAVLPRAWVQRSDIELGRNIQSVPSLLSLTPNQVDLEAEGPGMLVLSEIYYPGWHLMIDGASQPMYQVGELFRGAILSPGKHSVRFTFQPLLVYLGLGIASLTWLFIGYLLLRKP